LGLGKQPKREQIVVLSVNEDWQPLQVWNTQGVARFARRLLFSEIELALCHAPQPGVVTGKLKKAG
jgi:hypothetical protein